MDTQEPGRFSRIFDRLRRRPAQEENQTLPKKIVQITQNLSDEETAGRAEVKQIGPDYQGTNVIEMPRSFNTNDKPEEPPKGA